MYHTIASYLKTKTDHEKINFISSSTSSTGLTAVKANSLNLNHRTVATVHVADSLQKTPVKIEELPAPVKTELPTDVFKTWVPTTAFDVKSGNTEYYEVDVKKGSEEKAVWRDVFCDSGQYVTGGLLKPGMC